MKLNSKTMSAKEEYLKTSKEKIDNMPIEQLREYCWTIDRLAQTYFEAWQKAETITIKKEFQLSDEELTKRGKKLDKADEKEETESRDSLLRWLAFTIGLPRELSIPIVEHIHKFYKTK